MVEKRALIYIKLFVAFVKALLPAFTPNKMQRSFIACSSFLCAEASRFNLFVYVKNFGK